ncbi:MAG: 50S ribosomal protein L19 [bacterium]|nr:50S ribosomal protein L19 [bacterium]
MHQSIAKIAQASMRQNLPDFKVGQTVRLHQKIKEGGKERLQVFEGLVIKLSNGRGIDGTVTVRKVVDGVGVERLFAIHSPNVGKIQITKQSRVRRSKLYYMRDRSGKSARMRGKVLEDQVFEADVKKVEEEGTEVKAE